jgi:NAD+ synthetase
MQHELLEHLETMRQVRSFDPHIVLEAKVRALNCYFQTHGLRGAVVGVSGGIDSSVVLGILRRASQVTGSPIKRIMATSLPFTVDQGASNQDKARERAAQVSDSFGTSCHCIDLGEAFNAIRGAVRSQIDGHSNAWADGQLVAYLRTPALYYLSAVLTSTGCPAIVCGTTNRDEGAYLGFFGKASDGMVDVQVISDLHKSEVYALARLLEVPETTLRAAPTGDVFDGKTHLEMIGAPYDFVELYCGWLALPKAERDAIVETMSEDALRQFREWSDRIEAMHRYNAHKYVSGNPSVHLDILPRAVPGGWKDEGSFKAQTKERRSLVGEFDLSDSLPQLLASRLHIQPREAAVGTVDGSVKQLEGFLSKRECQVLCDAVARQKRLPVGINGILRDYKEGQSTVGSYRASAYCPQLAAEWWRRLEPLLPSIRSFDEYAHTDWCGHSRWKPVGINPAMRFIWYESGGELVVHYDAGFDPKDGEHHSLMSLVLYLTDCEPSCGGATRFIRDPQSTIPYDGRNFADWEREAYESEVIASINPVRGRALLFDHRLLHDSQPWSGTSPKVIIRTDVMFKRV